MVSHRYPQSVYIPEDGVWLPKGGTVENNHIRINLLGVRRMKKKKKKNDQASPGQSSGPDLALSFLTIKETLCFPYLPVHSNKKLFGYVTHLFVFFHSTVITFF